MDFSSPVIEALAHYVRGAATQFFILWALRILPFAHTNRMVRRLYWCTLFMAFNYSADAVLMICFTESSPWVDVVMRLADAISVPLVCAYSLEMLRFLGVRNCQLGACHHGSVPSGGLCRTLCRFLSRIDLCSGLVAQMCYVCCSGCRSRCERSRIRAVGGAFSCQSFLRRMDTCGVYGLHLHNILLYTCFRLDKVDWRGGLRCRRSLYMVVSVCLCPPLWCRGQCRQCAYVPV